jgi:hypothetical protein
MNSQQKKGVKLEEGHVYVLTYKLQSGNGAWWAYQSTMTYLGADKFPQYEGQDPRTRELSFNLRPHAGTQKLRAGAIMTAEDLGKSEGRDDSRHKPKKQLGRVYA